MNKSPIYIQPSAVHEFKKIFIKMKLFYVHFLLSVTLNLGAYMAEYFYARANPKCLNSRSDRRPRRLTTCAVLCEAPRAQSLVGNLAELSSAASHRPRTGQTSANPAKPGDTASAGHSDSNPKPGAESNSGPSRGEPIAARFDSL